jgi:phage-related protein
LQNPSINDIRRAKRLNEELRIIISAEIDKLKTELGKGQKELKKFEKQGKNSGGGIGTAMKAAGSVVGTAMKAMIGAVAAAGAAMVGLTESTREYRTQQAMLATAFQTSGGSAELATETYNNLYRVLGDSGQATEAAQHLAMLTTEEQALSEWTTICQGVYAKFGESLPIESLTEAANETAKTGELTGALADALNWAGVNEEEFKDKLWLCNTEAEREALIRETLTGLYGDAAKSYEETAGAILDANEAQAKLTDGLAAAGAAIEPVVTTLKAGLANALAGLMPSFVTFAEGFNETVNGVEGGAEKMTAGIKDMISNVLQTIKDALPMILTIGLDIIVALLEGIVAMLPDLISTAGDIISKLIDTLTTLTPLLHQALLDSIPLLIETLFQIVAEVLAAWGEVLPQILEQIVAILPQIVESITSNIPMLLTAAIDFLMAIVDAIPVIIPALIAELPGIIQAILDCLTEAIPLLIDGSIALLMGIIEAIPVIIEALVVALPQIIVSIVDFLLGNIPTLLGGAIKLFMALVTAIPQIIPKLGIELGKLVASVVTNLTGKLPDMFKNMWDKFLSGGKSALDGIKNTFKSIPDWFKNTFSSAWQKVKDVFSKGGKVFDGIKDGILDGLKSVINGLINGINKVIAVPFNGINSALQKIKNISIAGLKPFDWMPTISVPQIPKLYRGGVLEKGQVGLLEGSGAEAVVPLENNDAWLTKIAEKLHAMMDDGSGRDIILQVDGKTFARTSIKSINQLTKQTGKLDLVLA